jgi:PIN domain nuclease of toxin-antitoxin system
VRLLLDTHVLLWAVLNDPRLTAAQRAAITTGDLYVSAASVWEIGIKRALGKLTIPDDLFRVVNDAGCRPLPMSWTHAEAAGSLPPHHADPFDRMLIAQAKCEGLVLVSSDARMTPYDIDVIV